MTDDISTKQKINSLASDLKIIGAYSQKATQDMYNVKLVKNFFDEWIGDLDDPTNVQYSNENLDRALGTLPQDDPDTQAIEGIPFDESSQTGGNQAETFQSRAVRVFKNIFNRKGHIDNKGNNSNPFYDPNIPPINSWQDINGLFNPNKPADQLDVFTAFRQAQMREVLRPYLAIKFTFQNDYDDKKDEMDDLRSLQQFKGFV